MPLSSGRVICKYLYDSLFCQQKALKTVMNIGRILMIQKIDLM
jgi:hypothetical protein